MVPKLYPITGSWPGKLFLSSRPRGGDWLEEEVLGWRRHGIDTVVSLLTGEEEQELDLADEASEARKHDLAFLSYPIPDRGIPSNISTLSDLLELIRRDLQQGKNVLVHCRQGIGRTGLLAASLLIREGMEPESAIREVSKLRGVRIPETPEQESWIYGVPANVR
jgi:protein-tyrosine phosphatase